MQFSISPRVRRTRRRCSMVAPLHSCLGPWRRGAGHLYCCVKRRFPLSPHIAASARFDAGSSWACFLALRLSAVGSERADNPVSRLRKPPTSLAGQSRSVRYHFSTCGNRVPSRGAPGQSSPVVCQTQVPQHRHKLPAHRRRSKQRRPSRSAACTCYRKCRRDRTIMRLD